MTEKKIRHAQFIYSVEREEPNTRDSEKTMRRLSRRVALRGQTVDIPRPEDVERGEAAGAFEEDDIEQESPVAEEEAEEEEEPASGPDFSSHSALVAWIRDDKPTASEVIAAAGDDPVKAEALLDAEDEATNGNPRKSVLAALEKIENK